MALLGNDKLLGLLSDPMFQVGMGLLSHNADPSSTTMPGAITQGLAAAQQQQQTMQDRQQRAQTIQQLQGLLGGTAGPQDTAAIGGGLGVGGVTTPPTSPADTPPQNAPQGFGDAREVLGLLAAINPEAAASQYIGMAKQQAELQARQGALGRDDIVGSPVKLGSGNLGYLSRSQGVVDTGVSFAKSSRTFTAKDGSQWMVNPLTGEPSLLLSANQIESNLQDREDMVVQAGALRQYPRIEAGTRSSIDLIDSMISHPARAELTGFSTLWNTPQSFVPGSQEADYVQLQKRLFGEGFLQELKQLKAEGASLGQVTEREADRVIAAYTSLSRVQSDTAYRRELERLKQALINYRKAAATAAQRTSRFDIEVPTDVTPSAATPSTPPSASPPSTEALFEKYGITPTKRKKSLRDRRSREREGD